MLQIRGMYCCWGIEVYRCEGESGVCFHFCFIFVPLQATRVLCHWTLFFSSFLAFSPPIPTFLSSPFFLDTCPSSFNCSLYYSSVSPPSLAAVLPPSLLPSLTLLHIHASLHFTCLSIFSFIYVCVWCVNDSVSLFPFIVKQPVSYILHFLYPNLSPSFPSLLGSWRFQGSVFISVPYSFLSVLILPLHPSRVSLFLLPICCTILILMFMCWL